MPKDRNASFEPRLVPKHQRRLQAFNELVISLVARGMTVRDTRAHLQEIYGVEVSPELISRVTDITHLLDIGVGGSDGGHS